MRGETRDYIDVRANLRLSREVSGKEISAALRVVAKETDGEYQEFEHIAVDGEDSAVIAVWSCDQNGDLVIRTGRSLDDNRIFFNKAYRNIGIGSACWGGMKHAIYATVERTQQSVEYAKNRLEELLNKK
jgi:hypothetical protein